MLLTRNVATEELPRAAGLARAFRSTLRQLSVLRERIALDHLAGRWWPAAAELGPQEIHAGETAELLEETCARLLKELSETARSNSA